MNTDSSVHARHYSDENKYSNSIISQTYPNIAILFQPQIFTCIFFFFFLFVFLLLFIHHHHHYHHHHHHHQYYYYWRLCAFPLKTKPKERGVERFALTPITTRGRGCMHKKPSSSPSTLHRLHFDRDAPGFAPTPRFPRSRIMYWLLRKSFGGDCKPRSPAYIRMQTTRTTYAR